MEAAAKERTTGVGAGTSMGGGAARVVEDDAAVEEDVGVEDDAVRAGMAVVASRVAKCADGDSGHPSGGGMGGAGEWGRRVGVRCGLSS